MGNANVVAEHAVLGGTPQDLGFDSATDTFVDIGDDNTFREFVTIHRASKEGQATTLGDGNFLMNGVHIAHDCRLGNNIVLAPYAAIGGHVHIEDRAFISGGVMIHQFTKVGCFAMIGGNSKITQDVLPYMITDGVPGQVKGLNKVGLRRAGVSPDEMRVLKQAYQLLFHAVRPKEAIVKELAAVDSEQCRHLAEFIRSSRRGYHRV
jgi:UDP-N-acetylglucosamine acyltransferase